MRKLIALATFVVASTVLLAAQQTPVFRTRTDIVKLDVSVLDKNRRPVRGLTAADFIVFEDGKAQEISVFEEIHVPDPVEPSAAWIRDVTPDVATNEHPANRLWLIVVDDAMIGANAGKRDSKQVVRDVVEKLGPHDLASVIFTTDSREAQDFTNDRTKLLATLDNYSPAWTGLNNGFGMISNRVANPDWQFQLGALRTVNLIMEAMIATPHTRKAVIWITPGTVLGLQHEFYKAPLGSSADTRTMAYPMMQAQALDVTKEIFDLARRSNLPIYPIDINGCCAGGEWHLTFANNTGGRAVVNTNDFRPGIDAIFEENASYYLIGYNPTNSRVDGTFRRLEVKVDHPDVDVVRTRSSYNAPKPGDLATPSRSAVLARAIADPIAVRELPLRATAVPFAIPGRSRTAAVAIALGVQQPVPEGAAKARVSVDTDLHVMAFSTEGKLMGQERRTAKVTLRAGATGDADYEVLSRLDLLPGRYRLRLAAHHQAGGKTGTVMVDVIVPDFNKLPASISGIALAANPGRPSAPRNLLTNVLPVVPTAQRTFTASDRVTACLFLYQNQTSARRTVQAVLTTRVTDSRDRMVYTDSQTLEPTRFVTAKGADGASVSTPSGLAGGRTQTSGQGSVVSSLAAAEVQFPIPLARLSPGQYLLTIEATMGETVLRRDVQFEVK